MKEYRVEWSIDLHANSPEEAAKAARAIQLRTDTTANVFDVHDGGTSTQVDLQELMESEDA